MFTDILTPRQEYPESSPVGRRNELRWIASTCLEWHSDTTNCWLSTFGKPEDEARSVSVLVDGTFTVIPE